MSGEDKARARYDRRKGRRIRGYFPGGLVLTATWSTWDEWHDDKFGQEFDLEEELIGAEPSTIKAAGLSFWGGCERLEWIGDHPDIEATPL